MKTIRSFLLLFLAVGCVLCAFAQNGKSESKEPRKNKNVVATIARPTSPSPTPIGDKSSTDEFVIGAGDVLAINVWKEADISRVVPVRSDGRISLPLVGEIQAGGNTPKQLEAEISAKLKDFVSEPEVTVIVQEIKSQTFNVLGMVLRPGSYPLTKRMTVLDAIALAGGFRDFAKQKNIYVLRHAADGTSTRLPFNYKEVLKGRDPGQNVELQSNDSIVVP
jgi:polysaccharide biosynthesis/export protein